MLRLGSDGTAVSPWHAFVRLIRPSFRGRRAAARGIPALRPFRAFFPVWPSFFPIGPLRPFRALRAFRFVLTLWPRPAIGAIAVLRIALAAASPVFLSAAFASARLLLASAARAFGLAASGATLAPAIAAFSPRSAFPSPVSISCAAAGRVFRLAPMALPAGTLLRRLRFLAAAEQGCH